MTTELKCAVCDEGHLHLEQSKKPVEIEGTYVEVPFRIHWCDACGSRLGLSEDLRFNARAIRQARKKLSGLLTGEEVRVCRKQLNLSQEQAAQLFGGGPVAFSKYENDEVTQSEAMDRLIWVVSKFPFLVAQLAARHNLTFPSNGHVTVKALKATNLEVYFSCPDESSDFDQTLVGFDSVFPASNDSIFRSTQRSSPVIWKAA